MKQQGKPKRKKIIIIAAVLLLLLLTAPGVVSVVLYNQYFGARYETKEYLALKLDEFPGLSREDHKFVSDKGQTLKGYYYTSEGVSVHGILILAHGFGGGGHNSYMDVADFFARNGYGVFCFDATGNDESEGDGTEGMPQGLIDLDYAINYVENSDAFPDLPIVLWGHSWGGYCVSSVLSLHPEVKAATVLSGFDKTSYLIEAQGEQMVGCLIHVCIPYVNLYEKIKFGSYADYTGHAGFENSDTAVMIIQGAEDDVVPASYGYDLWYEEFENDSRFTFIMRDGFGHQDVYYSEEAVSYIENINSDLKAWGESLDYDYKSEENRDRFNEEMANWITEHLDRDVWTHIIDEDLMSDVLDFYNDNIG